MALFISEVKKKPKYSGHDPNALLKECGSMVFDIYKKRISDQLNIFREREKE